MFAGDDGCVYRLRSPPALEEYWMKTIATVLLCLAVAFAPDLAAATETGTIPRAIELQFALTVGADGKAKDLVPLQALPADVDQWIRQRVAAYTFQPATVNGQPRAAETTLYLDLVAALAADGKSGYRINNLQTGPKLVRGRYEVHPQEAGAGYFIVTYDANGRVTEATMAKSTDSIGGRSFRKWGVGLARSFRLKPETVAGHGVPGSATIPIVFCWRGEACPVLPPPPGDGADLGGELVAKSVLQALPPLGG
jgi:hypothetical protein